MKNSVSTIAITGGTHGNELTGVYLVNKFKDQPELVKRDSFETIVLHTNAKAIEKCTRYIDTDLNRTFTKNDLADPDKNSYEEKLAKEINQKLGPKGSVEPNVDFILDLHSTTANMGFTIIISNENTLTWQAAAYLKDKVPMVKIFRWKGDTEDTSFIHTISKNGFALEVGAVPQGVLRADIFLETERIVQHLLDFFEKYNSGNFEETLEGLESYAIVELVNFPRNEEGEIIAMVHPDIQDRDYIQIKQGDPLFLTFDHQTIVYEKEETLYALFINEAAYYEKGIALCLCRKQYEKKLVLKE